MSSADFDLARLRQTGLVTRVEYRARVSSTNDLARELALAEPRLAGLLVVADEQTAGRGRGSNRWWTGPGSLAFSLLLDPATTGVERRYLAMIALAAAVAIVETVEPEIEGERVGLHWPNDVYVGRRKLAGILVEGLPDGRHIVGIGLNVNNSLADAPAELQALVATLGSLAGKTFDRGELLSQLLSALGDILRTLALAPHELGRRSDALCLQHGKRLTIQCGAEQTTGDCAGIAHDGALLLDTPSGRQAFYSGVLVR